MKQQETLSGAQILIVDDQEANVRLLEGILRRAGYTRLTSTTDSRDVTSLFRTLQPDLILLDLTMPHLDGFEVLDALTLLNPDGSYLPILVLTADISRQARERALSIGARDFLTKPFDATEVLLRIKNLLETRFLHLQLQDQNQTLEEKVRERTRESEQAQFEILERLAIASEYRDDDTGQHTRRVGHVSGLLAQALGLPQDEVELIGRVAPLHDVGKIGISDDILLKPARLTVQEFEMMKLHTIIGARILSGGNSYMVRLAQTIALTHHERWDGTGYPRKLKGEAIPKAGRIVALADTFDALTHKRPYKEAWPYDEAVAEIKRQSGRQFDPDVVEVFLQMDKEMLAPPQEAVPLPKLPPLGFANLGDILDQTFWKYATEPLSAPNRRATRILRSE